MLRIHKASAGSGKTYALTKEYLKLLLGQKRGEGEDAGYRLRPLSAYGYLKPKAHGEILAVTFTNKATEEMTSRIINELASLADPGGHSPYLADFVSEFGTDAATLHEHARRALADVLYNFSWFNVSTIDSFFQRVLNTFSRELELSPNRNVELDEKYALSVAVGKMLASINVPNTGGEDERRERRYLEEWLRQYMMSMLTAGKGFNLLSYTSSVNAGLIADMGSFFNEKYKLHRKEIDGYLADAGRIVKFAQAVSPNGVMARRREAVQELCVRAAAMADDGVQKNLVSALEAIGAGNFPKDLGKTLTKVAADPDAAFKKNAVKSEALRNVLGEAAEAVVGYYEKAGLCSLLYGQVYQLGLFGRVHSYIEEFRKETDSMLLSDTGELLRRIISEDETPFIYERMGTAIHHYLIDEFQDTSQMQWENLKPLVLESLSHGYDNLIIGDEKQCIYRFRNSDPKLLGSRVEKLVDHRFPGAVGLRGTRIAENCNWRSSVDVVRFNNSLFNSLARQFDTGSGGAIISSTYAGLIQQIPDKHADLRGYVKVQFLPTENDADDGGRDLDALQLERMTREIGRQLDAGYRPSDIAVLVRKKSQGKAVITHLMDVMENDPSWRHGAVPVMSADSMEISQSPAVRMIVNVLRLATQPVLVTKPGGEVDADGKPVQEVNPAYRRYRLLHRFELCRFDMVEQTDEAGNIVMGDDGRPLMRRLTDREALAKAVAATSVPLDATPDAVQCEIDTEIKRLSEMESPTLLAMTERIIGRFLTSDARRKENAFITAFQDLVMDFSDNGEGNLNHFLQWWDRVGAFTNVAPPDGLDAINVLTIHKAKGLEYECVHIPYCSDPPVKYHSSMMKSMSWYRLDPAMLPDVEADCIPPYMPLPNNSKNKNIAALHDEAVEWETEQKTDALNVAYVAFTRAVSELCVYVNKMSTIPTPKSASKEGVPLLGDCVLNAIREMTRDFVGHCGIPEEAMPFVVPLADGLHETDDGELEFVAGSPTSPRRTDAGVQVAADAGNGSTRIDGTEAEVDYDGLLDEYQVFEKSDISAAMDFEDLSEFSLADERHRGTFLHSVLSKVNTPADLNKALARQAYRYRLTQGEAEECRAILERALSDERVRPWFEGFKRAIAERPLTAPHTLRRPDRVVWLADGSVVVIDYKFGKHNRVAYREQVRDYMNLLEAAGYSEVKGCLWFPLTGEIVEC